MQIQITDYMEKYDYENLYICQHKATGLKAFVGIHDTTLGPAVGGCRMWPYKNEGEAIEDVLRLAKGMTYKYAAAGVNLGGGKTVIIGDPSRDKSEAFFRALGRFLNRLNGSYYTGLDSGTVMQDMENIYLESEYVVTIPTYLGGAGPISPYTAWSTILGMEASLQELTGNSSLKDKTVAVQGVGDVGYYVVKYLVEKGAKEITISDIDDSRINRVIDDFSKHTTIKVSKIDSIYSTDCDIFSPCALGATINEETIPQLKCKIVSGSANNQLAGEKDGERLMEKGILYAPDFIVNAGGTVYDTDRIIYGKHNHDRAKKNVDAIYNRMCKVFELARKKSIPTYKAAEMMAMERIDSYKNIKIL